MTSLLSIVDVAVGCRLKDPSVFLIASMAIPEELLMSASSIVFPINFEFSGMVIS